MNHTKSRAEETGETNTSKIRENRRAKVQECKRARDWELGGPVLMTVEAAMSLARENKSAPVSWDKYSFLHSLAGFYRRVPVEAGGRDWDPCGTPQQ